MNSASFTIHGASPLFSSSKRSFLANSSWRSQSKHDLSLSIQRSNGLKSQVMAKANASPAKGNSTNEVIMVDPLEAKRLAAKQMQEIRAREKLKRQRQIEAINGAWAMIGLTAGLVIEGQTGKGILAQVSA